MTSSAILVFSRHPATSKTRLARDVGRSVATMVASALLEKTLQNMVPAQVSSRYLYWEGPKVPAVSTWAKVSGYTLRPQTGKDLGARMRNALEESLCIHDKTLLIGTDCPDLTCRIIHKALIELDFAPVYLVPTRDGGFSLIGIRDSAKESLGLVFHNVQWGSGSVMETMLTNLRSANISSSVATELRDLDTGADLWAIAERHAFLRSIVKQGNLVIPKATLLSEGKP